MKTYGRQPLGCANRTNHSAPSASAATRALHTFDGCGCVGSHTLQGDQQLCHLFRLLRIRLLDLRSHGSIVSSNTCCALTAQQQKREHANTLHAVRKKVPLTSLAEIKQKVPCASTRFSPSPLHHHLRRLALECSWLCVQFLSRAFQRRHGQSCPHHAPRKVLQLQPPSATGPRKPHKPHCAKRLSCHTRSPHF